MKCISTTIKRTWMDKILSGEKKIEYKDNTEYWRKRLSNIDDIDIESGVEINFLCGQVAYRYKVIDIALIIHKEPMDIDGVKTNTWYEIHLGERVQ